jgi:hypothetical protein
LLACVWRTERVARVCVEKTIRGLLVCVCVGDKVLLTCGWRTERVARVCVEKTERVARVCVEKTERAARVCRGPLKPPFNLFSNRLHTNKQTEAASHLHQPALVIALADLAVAAPLFGSLGARLDLGSLSGV